MKLAFYRGDGSFFSRLIRWWTGTVSLDDGRVIGPYTHAELVFTDGIWFSSDERDGGCRFKRVRTAAGDARWHFVDLPLSPQDEASVYLRARKINGLGYDKLGILKTAWRPVRESPDKFFCSEACTYCLHGAGLFTGTPPWRVTPVDLAMMAINQFGPPDTLQAP